MKVLFVIALVTLNSLVLAGTNCDVNTLPKSWATVQAKNVFFNAWQPNNYIGMPSFCVLNDFFSRSLNYWSHVKLDSANSTVQQDSANATDLSKDQINCGSGNSQVVWCRSHCQDKHLESLIIQSAIVNGSLPLAVSQQVFQQLDSPTDLTIAALHIDQNTLDIHVDYDYYDDKNFCSVFLKVKKSTQLPYALLLTAQRVI
ncbi:unnamed protein product [Caenorhabditis angaria]|uniref:Uncharacterized protein n=1 Tax=Caenorhabditis angaria TaxID=860376 RepID=A0A9P1N619_9PELO|nr:unnamed protein product [Caenorhabditis angaria]